MSSRNLRLTSEERQRASVFYKSLLLAKQKLKEGYSVADVKNEIDKAFTPETKTALEYLELADSINLNTLDNVSDGNQPILCIAGYIGEVRLIDNMYLD